MGNENDESRGEIMKRPLEVIVAMLMCVGAGLPAVGSVKNAKKEMATIVALRSGY
ncbi:MAG: hypothetical protein ABSB66_01140 [Candidatus Acidiferrales bacterium]|jgi:hypothetical protein